MLTTRRTVYVAVLSALLALACSRQGAPHDQGANSPPPPEDLQGESSAESGGQAPGSAPGEPGAGGQGDLTGGATAAGPSGPASPAAPASADGVHRVYYMGHSLINDRMPMMVASLARQHPKVSHEYGAQLLVGGGLADHWNDHDDPTKVKDGGFKLALKSKRYDSLVITERTPVRGNSAFWGGACHAAQIYDFAYKTNPKIQLYLYVGWSSYMDPTEEKYRQKDFVNKPRWELWRQEVDRDLPVWKGIASEASNNNFKPWKSPSKHADCGNLPGKPKWAPVRLIPAAQALVHLYDQLKRAPVGNIRQMKQVFHDEVHLTDTGNFYIAAVVFSSLYKQSAVGLSAEIAPELAPANYQAPDAKTAQALEKMAWEVAQKTY